jgi:hypothetical protein
MHEREILKRYHAIKHTIFPRPFERLGVKGCHLTGVEVGVFEGFHAESLLTYLDIYILYLIDPYLAYQDGQYSASDSLIQTAKQHAHTLLSQCAQGNHTQLVWIAQTVLSSMSKIPDQLDFVYLDGRHDYGSVSSEIGAFWPKIKPGGVLGGHDFYCAWAKDHEGVIRAACEFAVWHNLQLIVEMPDWWIVKT